MVNFAYNFPGVVIFYHRKHISISGFSELRFNAYRRYITCNIAECLFIRGVLLGASVGRRTDRVSYLNRYALQHAVFIPRHGGSFSESPACNFRRPLATALNAVINGSYYLSLVRIRMTVWRIHVAWIRRTTTRCRAITWFFRFAAACGGCSCLCVYRLCNGKKNRYTDKIDEYSFHNRLSCSSWIKCVRSRGS